MDCEEIRNLANAYLDGELPPASRAEFDMHLAGCAHCREEIEASRAFISRLKAGVSYFEAPPRLTTRMAQRLASVGGVVRFSPEPRGKASGGLWRLRPPSRGSGILAVS